MEVILKPTRHSVNFITPVLDYIKRAIDDMVSNLSLKDINSVKMACLFDMAMYGDPSSPQDGLSIDLQKTNGRQIYFFGCLLDLDTGYIGLGEKKLDYFIPVFDLYVFIRDRFEGDGKALKKDMFLKMIEDMKLAKKTPTEFMAGLKNLNTVKGSIDLSASVIANAIKLKNPTFANGGNITYTPLTPQDEHLGSEVLVLMDIFSHLGFDKLPKDILQSVREAISVSMQPYSIEEVLYEAFSGSNARLRSEVSKQKKGRKTSIDLIAYRLCTGANRHYPIDTPVTHIRQEVIEAEAVIDTIGDKTLGDIYKQGKIPPEISSKISTKATKSLKDIITGKSLEDANNNLIGVDFDSRKSAKNCFRNISTILQRFTQEAKKGG